ncbi:MAG TPA: hypothetical protein VGN72_20325 [Tepidisphaeraceae bacterium]|jgi:hypothetical protein|nr:hypothetical protein [Tepidisphaeraceae bacterium]
MPHTPPLLSIGLLLAAAAHAALPATSAIAGTIWREGEDATTARMNAHPWWYDQVDKSRLSGGAWLSNFAEGADKVGTAAYDVQVAEAGDHRLWVRANPTDTRLSYRIDGGDWTPLATNQAREIENIAADKKPDLRFISWVDGGQVTLGAGKHTVEFRFDSDNSNHGALDAFVLTTEDWTPSGLTKPGEAPQASSAVGPVGQLSPDQKETWAVPVPLPTAENRVLDLRYLNEERAGQHGMVRLSADGESFVRGDGQPIRFWPIISYGWRDLSPEDMDRQCRFLAAMGVNMVRIHANISNGQAGAAITDVNQKEIDGIKRYVKSCRDNGIYLTISPYWPYEAPPASWGLEGFAPDQKPLGPIFFNPKYQAAYKAWVKALYDTPNPHTSVRLADDPTVAIVQIMNEDSLLFWTVDAMPDAQKAILADQYATWLGKTYGSLDKAKAAWGTAEHEKDDWANGQPAFYIVWELTQPQTGDKAKRVRDQLRFIAETQHGFYAMIGKYYREELGCKQLINAMNWKSADKMTLDDVERWTYTANEVVAVNRYLTGEHEGENAGWRVDPGHYFTETSALKDPLKMPTNLKQVDGHPMLITETLWVPPIGFQSEAMFLTAVYQSLTGIDGTYWLGTDKIDYNYPVFPWADFPGGQKAHTKFFAGEPDHLGMMPANALLFRMGYVKQGETVVHESRPIDDLWDRKAPIIAETETFDPNRDAKNIAGPTGKTDVSRLAFMVGPVEVAFGEDPSKTKVADITPFIDADKKIVRSNTGEIALNWDKGLCTVNAPKAQGITGFLKDGGGRFEMGDVTVESQNEYATITVVPLDDQPLATSKRVLVQVGTRAELTGFQAEAVQHTFGDAAEPTDALRLVRTGVAPWRVANTMGTLEIANAALTKATRIEPNLSAGGDVAVRREGDRLIVPLPPDAMYLILE